jgi:hypothetical protein
VTVWHPLTLVANRRCDRPAVSVGPQASWQCVSNNNILCQGVLQSNVVLDLDCEDHIVSNQDSSVVDNLGDRNVRG